MAGKKQCYYVASVARLIDVVSVTSLALVAQWIFAMQ
jgi:hypothetical protein